MNAEVLVTLRKAFEHLDGKAASNQELNCGDQIMIGMAIDLIDNEMAKPVVSRNESQPKLLEVKNAVKKYYLALDRREHGGIAQDQAFNEIQQVLGMHWQRGEALTESAGEPTCTCSVIHPDYCQVHAA